MGERFKIDENLPREVQAVLVRSGHDAHSVHDERLGGCADDSILQACVKERRILVTLDLDFADARRYPASTHCGIWVLRPATQSARNAVSVLRGALALIEAEPTANRLWIAEPGRVRIRG
jgi:predicted nuclease of predicted toxin-antitoxin system